MKICLQTKLLRPHHWLKNLLVFIPMIAAHRIELNLFLDGVVLFILFSFVASSGYIFNDILDRKFDANHQAKKNRPIASGQIKVSNAIIVFLLLFTASLSAAYSINYIIFITLLAYFLLSLSYSLLFKKMIIIDIVVLSGLYSMRIVIGGVVLSIPPSFWLVVFSMFFFLSLACIKRVSELIAFEGSKKKKIAGRGYDVEDREILTQISLVSGFISALVILLYLRSDDIYLIYQNINYMYFIGVVVIYWISRVNIKAIRGEVHSDPLLFAIQDKVSICA